MTFVYTYRCTHTDVAQVGADPLPEILLPGGSLCWACVCEQESEANNVPIRSDRT